MRRWLEIGWQLHGEKISSVSGHEKASRWHRVRLIQVHVMFQVGPIQVPGSARQKNTIWRLVGPDLSHPFARWPIKHDITFPDNEQMTECRGSCHPGDTNQQYVRQTFGSGSR